MDAISLTCPSCGSNLQITKEIDRFACGYCGKQLLVNRTGGIVSLKPLMEKLEGIGAAVDRTASELAIQRLKEEIMDFEDLVKDANNRKNTLLKLTTLGIVGIIIGVFGFMFSTNNPGTSVFLCGVLPIIFSGALLAFTYWANKGWNMKIEKFQSKMNDKKAQLKKHLNIVNS